MKQIDYKQFHTKQLHVWLNFAHQSSYNTDLNFVHSPPDVRTVSTFLYIALEIMFCTLTTSN